MSESVRSVTRVVKSGFWLYLSMIVNNVGGFIYWLIISWVAGPGILGVTSATIGLAAIVNALLNLGIGVGLQHHIGICTGLSDKECLRRSFWSVIILPTILYLGTGLSLIMLGFSGFGFLNFSPKMITFAGILVCLGIVLPITASLTGLLETKTVFLASLLGNALKILLGVTLVMKGFDFIGAVLGYTMIQVSMMLIGGYKVLERIGMPLKPCVETAKKILRSGVVAWIPNTILLAGQWLGVLAVYGSTNPLETGYYYVAFIITNFILGIGINMLNLLLPVLSGLSDGRKRAASNVLKISLVLVFPLAAYIATYPYLPLDMLGKDYTSASPILSILLLSTVPLLIYTTIYSLTYSYRRYKEILLLGLTQNIPRFVLYLFLTPIYHGLGAATAFTTGTLSGFLGAIIQAKRIKYRIDWGLVAKVITIPSISFAIAYVANINWIVGGIILLTIYLLYGRLRILSRQDIKLIANAFLGEEMTYTLFEKLGFLIDFFFPQ